MIEKGAHVLVAVSGGIDSIVLLHVLCTLSSERSFTVSVGHIDHGLRGEASELDSGFVQDVATATGLPFLRQILTSANLAAHKSHGREGAARNARLSALSALADEVGATRIALGHSLDDHAETILYHLARGAGATGLRGISPVRLPFIRPLIRVARADIHAYAVAHSLTWREDASNADVTFARNRIRHHVLPELRLINPRITEALSRNADLLTDLDEASGFLVRERILQVMLNRDEEPFSLSRDKLTKLPSPVLQLVLREGIRHVRGNLEGISLAHIDDVRALVTSSKGHGEVFLPDIRIRRQGNVLEMLSEPVDSPDSWSLP
ncbi:tRNA lysidine(34) synthetase TilS, partial [Candidatus Bipolaricaulota bacterium]|nr:tRNA lysidine(34) synthetase TilS [Candidatus Bipolaricaulota bacterium]